MRHDDTEILLPSSLLCAAESTWEGMSTIQLFFRRSRHRRPWRTVLHRESCLVKCPNQASFRRLTVASKGSCGPRVAVMFRTYSLVLYSVKEMPSSL
ncbi:hypothetical protein DPMN_034733 [Dreissena polymorpha]|uniref:Uncharacterized protein n=1 Tax=Dreissena polymorpha TaxID=45954 RepID=A0A9D4RMC3_DREPO|nr:hypothetical protein DPMN_034733 [Dreissena polymorpha]